MWLSNFICEAEEVGLKYKHVVSVWGLDYLGYKEHSKSLVYNGIGYPAYHIRFYVNHMFPYIVGRIKFFESFGNIGISCQLITFNLIKTIRIYTQ